MPQKVITKYLYNLGFNPANLGFKYLKDLFLICKETPNVHHKMMDLYQAVAAKNNTTYTAVERAIRHGIATSELDKIDNRRFIAQSIDELEFNA